MKGRYCDRCGKAYWKANRVRLWVAGRRYDDRICLSCLSGSATQRILVATQIGVVKRGAVR
jgi:RNase P subunit RPR2